MTTAQQQTATASPPRGRRRALAWLCCLLAVLFSSPVELLLPVSRAVTSAPSPGEGERRSPLEEDDDDGVAEHATEADREQHERPDRRRRGRRAAGALTARLAHLPHSHAAGSSHPPACTPFERGAHLPLRC